LSELDGDAAFSSDGNKVIMRLSRDEDCKIEVWDINSAKRVKTSPAFGGFCERLFISLSSDDVLVPSQKLGSGVSAGTEIRGTTVRWNIQSGEIDELIPEGKHEVKHIAFSSDSSTFVTLGRYLEDNELIRLWGVQRNEIILQGHEAAVTHASFDPESNLIATASEDNTVHLWDIEPSRLFLEEEECQPIQMEQKETLYSETKYDEKFIKSIFEKDEYILDFINKINSSIGYVTLNRSRSRAFISIFKGKSYLWDTRSGKPLGTLYGAGDGYDWIPDAIFNSEETCIQVRLNGGDELRWRAFPTTQSLIDYARQIVPRQLSCEERRQFGLDIGEQCTDK